MLSPQLIAEMKETLAHLPTVKRDHENLRNKDNEWLAEFSEEEYAIFFANLHNAASELLEAAERLEQLKESIRRMAEWGQPNKAQWNFFAEQNTDLFGGPKC